MKIWTLGATLSYLKHGVHLRMDASRAMDFWANLIDCLISTFTVSIAAHLEGKGGGTKMAVGPSNKSMRTLYGKDRVKLSIKRGKKRGRS